MELVNPVKYDKDGDPIMNSAAEGANSDRIRAERLLRAGQTEERQELELIPVFVDEG